MAKKIAVQIQFDSSDAAGELLSLINKLQGLADANGIELDLDVNGDKGLSALEKFVKESAKAEVAQKKLKNQILQTGDATSKSGKEQIEDQKKITEATKETQKAVEETGKASEKSNTTAEKSAKERAKEEQKGTQGIIEVEKELQETKKATADQDKKTAKTSEKSGKEETDRLKENAKILGDISKEKAKAAEADAKASSKQGQNKTESSSGNKDDLGSISPYVSTLKKGKDIRDNRYLKSNFGSINGSEANRAINKQFDECINTYEKALDKYRDKITNPKNDEKLTIDGMFGMNGKSAVDTNRDFNNLIADREAMLKKMEPLTKQYEAMESALNKAVKYGGDDIKETSQYKKVAERLEKTALAISDVRNQGMSPDEALTKRGINSTRSYNRQLEALETKTAEAKGARKVNVKTLSQDIKDMEDLYNKQEVAHGTKGADSYKQRLDALTAYRDELNKSGSEKRATTKAQKIDEGFDIKNVWKDNEAAVNSYKKEVASLDDQSGLSMKTVNEKLKEYKDFYNSNANSWGTDEAKALKSNIDAMQKLVDLSENKDFDLYGSLRTASSGENDPTKIIDNLATAQKNMEKFKEVIAKDDFAGSTSLQDIIDARNQLAELRDSNLNASLTPEFGQLDGLIAQYDTLIAAAKEMKALDAGDSGLMELLTEEGLQGNGFQRVTEATTKSFKEMLEASKGLKGLTTMDDVESMIDKLEVATSKNNNAYGSEEYTAALDKLDKLKQFQKDFAGVDYKDFGFQKALAEIANEGESVIETVDKVQSKLKTLTQTDSSSSGSKTASDLTETANKIDSLLVSNPNMAGTQEYENLRKIADEARRVGDSFQGASANSADFLAALNKMNSSDGASVFKQASDGMDSFKKAMESGTNLKGGTSPKQYTQMAESLDKYLAANKNAANLPEYQEAQQLSKVYRELGKDYQNLTAKSTEWQAVLQKNGLGGTAGTDNYTKTVDALKDRIESTGQSGTTSLDKLKSMKEQIDTLTSSNSKAFGTDKYDNLTGLSKQIDNVIKKVEQLKDADPAKVQQELASALSAEGLTGDKTVENLSKKYTDSFKNMLKTSKELSGQLTPQSLLDAANTLEDKLNANSKISDTSLKTDVQNVISSLRELGEAYNKAGADQQEFLSKAKSLGLTGTGLDDITKATSGSIDDYLKKHTNEAGNVTVKELESQLKKLEAAKKSAQEFVNQGFMSNVDTSDLNVQMVKIEKFLDRCKNLDSSTDEFKKGLQDFGLDGTKSIDATTDALDAFEKKLQTVKDAGKELDDATATVNKLNTMLDNNSKASGSEEYQWASSFADEVGKLTEQYSKHKISANEFLSSMKDIKKEYSDLFNFDTSDVSKIGEGLSKNFEGYLDNHVSEKGVTTIKELKTQLEALQKVREEAGKYSKDGLINEADLSSMDKQIQKLDDFIKAYQEIDEKTAKFQNGLKDAGLNGTTASTTANNMLKNMKDQIGSADYYKNIESAVSSLDKMMDTLSKKNSAITGTEAYKNVETMSEKIKSALAEVKNADGSFNMDALSKLPEKLKDIGINSKDASENIKKMMSALNEQGNSFGTVLTKGTAEYEQKLSKIAKITDEVTKKTHNWTKAATGESSDSYYGLKNTLTQLANLQDQLNSGTLTTDQFDVQFASIRREVDEYSSSIRQAGEHTKTLKEQLAGAVSKFSSWYVVSQASMMVFSKVKEAVQNVRELDAAMTELKKVTNETDTTYNNFISTASSLAKSSGTSLVDTINATADFARLGYNTTEAIQLAKAAMIYSNVGDDVNSIADATESIVSTMQAFNVDASNAMSIVDKFNAVGKLLPKDTVMCWG